MFCQKWEKIRYKVLVYLFFNSITLMQPFKQANNRENGSFKKTTEDTMEFL